MSDTSNDLIPRQSLAWTAGSDAPEKRVLNVGFMPLSDAASVVVAATQGFAQPYGLTLELHRQTSWAGVADKLASGELDAAHALYGMVYALELGLGGAPATDMAVLMGLNHNGQSINLSQALVDTGITRPAALCQRAAAGAGKLTFAHTFPTGSHALWLYYWLASQGIHPLHDVNSVVVPPPQMLAHLQAARIDGFCAGEPWSAHAVALGHGCTVATSQSIWPDHPEKVLACTRAFVEQCPNTARALLMAVLDASRFIEASAQNRRSTAQLMSGREYLDLPLSSIEPRFMGLYDDGLGHQWQDQHPLRFHNHGAVNVPYLSDGMWFMTQFRRWGLLRDDPDYRAVAGRVQRLDLYRAAAGALGIAVPASPLRRTQLLDGSVWDGSDPAAYARSFALHARHDG
ncbi:CmpA/NrtA family ABC transporter substrate-binding protein [Pseudomonas sp. S32]|uniref:CmpA/NrtA family ABC transporter substrate-binding protein n=1 Tax=Pseudomonas sp. S32 TaxID=2767448 RepID=UPI00191351A0|nr:CmpA/NrtA family ABC transporter substrate-binding protein [Pseudomonas sp. S32]MBK5004585.1 ABC transporter substrate-binding protein [Pseudomonas sp. S32]